MEFEKAKQILNKSKVKQYTDEQINETLKLMAILAEVFIKNSLKEKSNEKCNNLR